MTRPRLEIVPVGAAPLDPAVLTHLRDGIERALGITASLGERVSEGEVPAPSEAAQRTTRSGPLLDALIDGSPDRGPDRWLLGVTALDLTAPGRTHVFGEATHGGPFALVGVARFGVPAEASPRLLARVLKEALHELGHLAGLEHCDRPECPMSFAARVADVDRKNPDFCEQCAAELGRIGILDRSGKSR